MPSLKAKPGSGCAVETKVIGQYSPQHSDWHVQCGPKMRIFSVLASRCGLQIESRFFLRDKHMRLKSSLPHAFAVAEVPKHEIGSPHDWLFPLQSLAEPIPIIP